MNDPKEEANRMHVVRAPRPHIQSRRIDIESVTVRFSDGTEITAVNGNPSKLMSYREHENATGTREVALKETPERRWVEYDVSWSVEMVKDQYGGWHLPD